MLTPLADSVVIAPEPLVRTSPSGLTISVARAMEKPVAGTVLAVGPGKALESGILSPMTVKPGDRVLLPSRRGHAFKDDGKDVIIFCEADLLAITDIAVLPH